MFRTLILNTMISAFAYLVVSVVGLLIVPLLVGAYGISQYGMLVLARLFFPSSMFGVFDLGFAEIATQAVARARVDGDWRRTSGQIALLFLLGVAVGSALGAVIAFHAEAIAAILNIEAQHHDSFVRILQITGAALVVVFPGLVFEGILKGYEAFRQLRTCEVMGTIAYALLAAGAVWQGHSYAAVAYAFVASLLLRATLVIFLTLGICRDLTVARWSAEDRRDVLLRCRVMVANKILGTGQAQGAPILIGLLLNSAAVGVYDVLVRLPRFAKSILGLLNTAVLPIAARLETAADNAQLTRLNRVGLIAVATLAMPPLAAGAVFSEPILRWWIGRDFTEYWMWQAAMFAVPALSVLVSYGATSLLLRPSVVAVLNRIALLQIVIQIIVSLALIPLWQERAFIFGQFCAMCLTFFMQMHVICRQHGLTVRDLQPLGLGIGATGACIALSIATDLSAVVQGPVSLVAMVGSWTLGVWCILFLSMYSREQRRTLVSSLVALARNRRGK